MDHDSDVARGWPNTIGTKQVQEASDLFQARVDLIGCRSPLGNAEQHPIVERPVGPFFRLRHGGDRPELCHDGVARISGHYSTRLERKDECRGEG